MTHKGTSVTERRIQIYLPEEQYRGVNHLADEKQTSFAQVVREAIGEYLRSSHTKWDRDPITRHIGLFASRDKDLSTHHDRYIYDGS